MLLGGELGVEERSTQAGFTADPAPLLSPEAAAILPSLYEATEPHEPLLAPAGEPIAGFATRYGEAYNGQALGCGGGHYSSADASIAAVGPEREAEWPCGTYLRVCGPAGCADVIRKDGCPGCSAYVIDLSEAGLWLVCGPGSGVCRVTIQKMQR